VALHTPRRPSFDGISDGRRRNMSAVRAKNSAAELTVRRILHSLGYRYRLHRRDLPGRPDIVLARRRKIVEVRGCFWHRHPDPDCSNAVLPATRRAWWSAKLHANVERDARNLSSLEAAGWDVLILWECELADGAAVAARLRAFLGPPRWNKNRISLAKLWGILHP
jgi:DNA mismatch endonuclease Vsr